MKFNLVTRAENGIVMIYKPKKRPATSKEMKGGGIILITDCSRERVSGWPQIYDKYYSEKNNPAWLISFFSKSKNLGFGLKGLNPYLFLCVVVVFFFLNWHRKVNSHTKLCWQWYVNAPVKTFIGNDRGCAVVFLKCQAVANRAEKK